MPMTSPSEPRPDSGTSSGRYKEDDDVWMSAVAGGVASGGAPTLIAQYEQQIAAEKARRAPTTTPS